MALLRLIFKIVLATIFLCSKPVLWFTPGIIQRGVRLVFTFLKVIVIILWKVLDSMGRTELEVACRQINADSQEKNDADSQESSCNKTEEGSENDHHKDEVLSSLYQQAEKRRAEFQLLKRKQLRKHQERNLIPQKAPDQDQPQTHSYNPEELLPLEIWELIAQQTDAKDVYTWLALYRSNQILKADMENRKVVALLPEVLKVVSNTLTEKEIEGGILQCRRVSKKWRKAIDIHFQNDELLNFSRDFPSASASWPNTRVSSVAFSDELDAVITFTRYIIEARKAHERNGSSFKVTPFPTGNFTVFDWWTDFNRLEIPRFRCAITHLLRDFGQLVQQFSWMGYLQSSHTASSEQSWYATLSLWFELMPNLKRINIWMHPLFKYQSDRLYKLLVHSPFPNLPCLTILQAENVPYSVLRSLMVNNPQIKKLRLGTPDLLTRDKFWKNKRINKFAITEFYFVTNLYSDILLMELVEWPLTHLQIEARKLYSGLAYEDMFRMLRKFKETLVYLKLETPGSFARDFSEPLDLPNVTEMAWIIHGDIYLDCLLPLHSLESLSIQDVSLKDFPLKQTYVKFPDHTGATNLWSLFPRLKKIAHKVLHLKKYAKEGSSCYYRPASM